MHFSLDDTIQIFSDLTNKKNVYKSIFENPTLAYLYELHKEYGIVVSCYVYLEDETFKLEKTTDVFSSQFSENAHWLKFGFHARDYKSNYGEKSVLEAKNDYDDCIRELLRITGNENCIDRVPRLHYFAGNFENSIIMRDTQLGILGLLSADDDRDSYWFKRTDNSDYPLDNRDSYTDSQIELIIFPTDLRMETKENFSEKLENSDDDVLIIFTHEILLEDSDIKERIKQSIEYSYKRGYLFDFPMNYVN